MSMDYAALREGGMELIRQWAKDTWTDHNVHDPGITLLEAFSYAMTELGFRVQLDVADLLRSGEAHGISGLEPSRRVLPSGPVTTEDLRRLLLDHPLVGDARVSWSADSEIPFYEEVTGNPPLTYTPGKSRVRPSGLYDVLVEFRKRELNANDYSLPVTTDDHQSYDLDLALPHWDEDAAAPFREGAAIVTINMEDAEADAWRPLPEPHSYFGAINVTYTGFASAPAAGVRLWALLRIPPAVEDPGKVLKKAREALETKGTGTVLEEFAGRARQSVAAVHQLQRYLSGWRNLGEEAVRLGGVRLQEIAVSARLEVTGGIDLEALLAGIFMDVDRMLSPPVRFESLADRRAGESDPGRIYDGPLLRHGFLDPEGLRAARPAVLYTSDILRLIMRRRSRSGTDLVAQENPGGRDIVAVTGLTLSNFVNNRPITTDARDCLRLVEIERYRPRLSLAKSLISTVRNDSKVNCDLVRVKALFLDLQKEEENRARPADPSPVWPVTRGEILPVEDYTPLQNDLPDIYGVGEAALPDSVGPERRAAARQLKGYLLLFEQFLADFTAQLGNINRFFSADPGQDASYFTRVLFDLPGMAKLLKRFPVDGDWQAWQAFLADPDNPVILALQDAAEGHERLLDRRNRMLDHLLARQGEDTVALGQDLHRWAQQELLAGGVPPDRLTARMSARREAANARLLRAKSALLRDAPVLNAYRLLAGGSDPFWRNPALLRIDESATRFRWTLVLDDQDRLRSIDAFDTATDAAFDAEDALVLAGRNTFYSVVDIGAGRCRYQLKDGAGTAARLIGESPQTFAGDAAAGAAMAETAAAFAALRLESSLTPMARRIAHLTGIRSLIRRRLLVPIGAQFEIFDESVGGGLIAKRWRFLALPGHTGQILLSSASHFEAATDQAAIALAEKSIRQVLHFGIKKCNYMVMAMGAASFSFELRDPAGQIIALRNPPCNSRDEAERGIAETLAHLCAQFEIYDEVDTDTLIEKRWRFWELPGRTGKVLLSSMFHFEAATEAKAFALAEESIRQVLRYGMDEWNYLISPAGPTTFNFELQNPAGQTLALRNTPWASRRAAEQGIAETVDHLYRFYSAEGFHLVEHLLLRPRQEEDAFLSLPDDPAGWVQDPYSQRLSLVFPSGYARDFSETGKQGRVEVTPHRFRDLEFRRHAERMVQQACPAHLWPAVYWVDRQAPGSPDSEASFDRFEERYFDWLYTVLIPGAPAGTIRDARNRLVESLNAIADDH